MRSSSLPHNFPMKKPTRKSSCKPKPKTVSPAELLRLEAQQGREDLFYFSKYILGYNLLRETVHQPLCDILSFRSPLYRAKRKLILLPRDTFKSTIATVSLPLHLLTRSPNLSILIDCEVFATAKGFLSEIKARVEEPSFVSRYGNWIPGRTDAHRWKEDVIEILPRTRRAKEGSIACAGVDKSITGHHYDVVICDDLVGETNYNTAEQLDKVRKHFNLVSESILKKSGVLVVVGTRWNDADVYGHILELAKAAPPNSDGSPLWDVIIRPACCPAPASPPRGPEASANIEDDATLSQAEWPPKPTSRFFFPERLDVDTLNRKWEAMDDELFFSQYLLDPTPQGASAFNAEWFRFYNDLPREALNFFIAVDPSTATKHGDYSAIVVVAVDSYQRWYVVELLRDKINPGELIDFLFMLNDRYHPMAIGIETVAFQNVLMHFLQEAQIRQNKFLPVRQLRTSTGVTKEQRIRSLVPYFKQGQIFFPHPPPSGVEVLIQELKRFPKARHDDTPDALAYIPQLVIAPQLPKEMPKDATFTETLWNCLEREHEMHARKNRGDPPWMQ